MVCSCGNMADTLEVVRLILYAFEFVGGTVVFGTTIDSLSIRGFGCAFNKTMDSISNQASCYGASFLSLSLD